MTETVNQGNNTANETQEERTFTQSQLDAIIQAGCDVTVQRVPYYETSFQSTHPMRGATLRLLCDLSSRSYFNPRTPCGVRLDYYYMISKASEFQSTHPMRGATPMGYHRSKHFYISIHAPHAGCDQETLLFLRPLNLFQSTHPMRGATEVSALPAAGYQNFNPRTPCGVRPRSDPAYSAQQ